MNFFTADRFRSFGILLVLLCATNWIGPALTAGEAIQFSNTVKSRPGPGDQNKLTKERLSMPDRVPASTAREGASAAESTRGDTRKLRTKDDKRRNLADLEKKNWMAVEPGQLQNEEDEKNAFDVREYDIETGGKEKTSADIWFTPKGRDDSRNADDSRARGTPSRTSSQNRPKPGREAGDPDSRLRIGKAEGQTTEQPFGVPSAKELQVHDPLAPDIRLNETFGGGNSPSDQNRRGDLGLRTSQTPSLGFGRDASAKPASSLWDNPKSQPSVSSGSSPGGFGFSGNRNDSFGAAPLTRPSGFGGDSPLQTQPRINSTLGSSRDNTPTRPSFGR